MSSDSPETRIAIGGYDPVSYFAEGHARKGTAQISIDHAGSTWQFSSRENAERFRASPADFMPAYGGRCAFACSLGKEETGDPTRWAIRGGRLFLNSNAVAHLLWKVIPGRIAAADQKARS